MQRRYNVENIESKIITIRCALYFCRRTINRSGEEDTIKINTITKDVLVDDGLSDELHSQEYEADDERDNTNIADNSSSDSSAGENDRVTRLPRNIRRRKNYFRRERE